MKNCYVDVEIPERSGCHFVSHSIEKHCGGWSLLHNECLGKLHKFAWEVEYEFSTFALV